MTLLIAGYILWHVQAEVGGVVTVLMLGSPGHLDVNDVVGEIEAIPGVQNLHHVHLWMMQEHDTALEAHLVISQGHWGQGDMIKEQAKEVLKDQFGITHSTLELECARHACPSAQRIGHATT